MSVLKTFIWVSLLLTTDRWTGATTPSAGGVPGRVKRDYLWQGPPPPSAQLPVAGTPAALSVIICDKDPRRPAPGETELRRSTYSWAMTIPRPQPRSQWESESRQLPLVDFLGH